MAGTRNLDFWAIEYHCQGGVYVDAVKHLKDYHYVLSLGQPGSHTGAVSLYDRGSEPNANTEQLATPAHATSQFRMFQHHSLW